MIGLDFKLPPEEQITAAAAGQTRIKWDERIAGHVNDADNKVKELIYDGIVQGQSYSDVAKGIKERFDITASKAETIARTESHRAREMGNMAATIEAAEMGINMMRRWLATLDGRTRDTHGAMDGQEIEVYDDNGEFAFFESPEGGSALYPGGFGIASEDINCRCSTIDIVKGYEPTTRRARDEFGKGEVIPYTNFTDYAQAKGWATHYAGAEPKVGITNIVKKNDGVFDVVVDNNVVGEGRMIAPDDEKGIYYLERLDIDKPYRNKGYGTKTLEQLRGEYGDYYFAPDNEDAKRLYDRVANVLTSSEYDEFGFAVDQGFGVYKLEGVLTNVKPIDIMEETISIGGKKVANLVGSEKQIVWASDIVETMEKQVDVLREAASKYANPNYVTREFKDPLRGTVTVSKIPTYGLTPKHEQAELIARHWWPSDSGTLSADKKVAFLNDTADALEKALKTETSAEYWIKRRPLR